MQLNAQTKVPKSSKKMSVDSFLLTRKGWFHSLAKNLVADTTTSYNGKKIVRNDLIFKKYKDKIIRQIDIQELDFGTSIIDTNNTMKTRLTHLANSVHRKTRPFVIQNNLFFKKNDKLQPFLLADNERYLRSLPYFQDAKIVVKPVRGSKDSVDVVVVTKDIIALGISVNSLSFNQTNITMKEDNLRGWGDRISISTLYDNHRFDHFGVGADYIKRNVSGSFIDLSAGFSTFYGGINIPPQEGRFYLNLTKPLINPYTKWTYSLDLSTHVSKQLYDDDSLFLSDQRYKYYDVDGWVGYNTNAQGLSVQKEDQRLRGLIGLRLMKQQFQYIPMKYDNGYFWQYTDIAGVLSSYSVFRQDFYKTNYIYGFGTSEDVPTGIDISVTSGYIRRQTLPRPYFGFSFERYYFSNRQNYFDFIVRSDAYLHNGKLEDVNLLGNINYFSHLRTLNEKWKQRTFLSVGISKQLNTVLNVPLLVESDFGLPQFNNGLNGGYFRSSFKGESDFFAPWSLAGFKFAPFVFYNATYFIPAQEKFAQGNMFSAIGGGVRTRNENLVFGTIELKAYYFPTRGYYNNSFKIAITTGLRFKYNTNFIRKPDFVQIN